MRAHTRTHPTDSFEIDDTPMKAEDFFREVEILLEKPRWAIHLQGARQLAEMTQTELSKKLGVPQSHISAMENGRRAIGKKIAKKLADLFELDYRTFL